MYNLVCTCACNWTAAVGHSPGTCSCTSCIDLMFQDRNINYQYQQRKCKYVQENSHGTMKYSTQASPQKYYWQNNNLMLFTNFSHKKVSSVSFKLKGFSKKYRFSVCLWHVWLTCHRQTENQRGKPILFTKSLQFYWNRWHLICD